MVRVVPDSRASTSCVLRAMWAEKSVGSASASSSALVWSDCVPPAVAAIASIIVRATLLKTSCAVSDQPEVWQCVRSISERGSAGVNFAAISSAHKEARGAELRHLHEEMHADAEEEGETRRESCRSAGPPRRAARTYSRPSASV